MRGSLISAAGANSCQHLMTSAEPRRPSARLRADAHRQRRRYCSRVCGHRHRRDHRVPVCRVRDRMVHPKAARAPPRRAAGRTMRLRTAVPLRRLLTRSRHVQRDRLTAAQAKPRRGGDRSGALVARDAKGYVSSPSPSSERRDCGSPLLARQFRSPAFKETFCYSRGATTKPPHLSDSLLASLVTQPHPSGRGFLLCGSGGTDARPHVRIEDPRHIKAPPERARCSASG